MVNESVIIEMLIGAIVLLSAIVGYFIRKKYKSIDDKDVSLEKLLTDVSGSVKTIADELVSFRILHAKESEGVKKDVKNIDRRVTVLEKIVRE